MKGPEEGLTTATATAATSANAAYNTTVTTKKIENATEGLPPNCKRSLVVSLLYTSKKPAS